MKTFKETLGEIGNLLDSFLGKTKESKINIIRVYPYESFVSDRIITIERQYIDIEDPTENEILKIIDAIRKKVNDKGWDDNKIVIETNIGPFTSIFIGFWDDFIYIGRSVVPSQKIQPRCDLTLLGFVKEIEVFPNETRNLNA